MAKESIIRFGRGREKVTQDQINLFLNHFNISSLDDIPKCSICGKNRVRVVIKQFTMDTTCGKNNKCLKEVFKELNNNPEIIRIGKSREKVTKDQINSFLNHFNLNSLNDIPRCQCGAKLYFNIKDLKIGNTCGKNECLHDKLSKVASKRSLKLIEEGRWRNPVSLLTKDELKKRHSKAIATLKKRYTPEELRERMSKMSLSQDAETRSIGASKANRTRWLKGNHSFQQISKEKRSEAAKKAAYTRIKNGICIVSKIETECFNFLKSELDDNFAKQQFQITGLIHPYDMYFPRYNLIIEFDGDYYHRDKKEYDTKMSEIAINNGYFIYRIPEHCYREDRFKVLNNIKEYLNGIR